MKTYEIQLESTTPIVFGRQIDPLAHPKEDGESAADFDLRIWPEKAHWSGEDRAATAIIPCVYFKRALEDVAQYLGLPVPGKPKATYTKHFKAGVQIIGLGVPIDVTRDTINSVAISCNVDGKRGSGARVTRRFPTVPKWRGIIRVLVVDAIVTKDVLLEHLEKAGMLVGVGSFRLNKGNSSGGFRVVSVKETKL